RGVGERGGQGVWPGGLDGAVAAVGFVLHRAAVKVGLFGGRQGPVWVDGGRELGMGEGDGGDAVGGGEGVGKGGGGGRRGGGGGGGRAVWGRGRGCRRRRRRTAGSRARRSAA